MHMKIGLIPMAAKPYHAGHDALVRMAAKENDKVYVYVSTQDREGILGSDMMSVWENYIKPTLPDNVKVKPVEVPVSSVYKKLEEAEAMNSKDRFSIYSDTKDIQRYRTNSLKKVANRLFNERQIKLCGVDRAKTVLVSATEMRRMLSVGDSRGFIKMLPPSIQEHGEEIYSLLNKRLTEVELVKKYVKLAIQK